MSSKKIVIERTRDLIYLKFVATDFSPKIISPRELFRGHVTLQLNARAIEAGVQVSPSSYGTLCCLWLFQALWTR